MKNILKINKKNLFKNPIDFILEIELLNHLKSDLKYEIQYPIKDKIKNYYGQKNKTYMQNLSNEND